MNNEDMENIKILGAGLSGLTAAINLVLKGYKVEVYERNLETGMQIKENAQMLPNWLAKESDIIQELEKCNIKINPVGQIKESIDKITDYYKDILGSFNLSLLYEFSGFSGFEIPQTAIKNNSLYIGEAAGFQDPLFGFGMKYAIKSGHFAALSIIGEKNYDTLWKKSFLTEMRKLLVIRNLFYSMDEKTMFSLLRSGGVLKKIDIDKIKSLLDSQKLKLFLFCYNKLSKLRILLIQPTCLGPAPGKMASRVP